MKERFWKAFAWLISREPIVSLLIAYAKREPYFHLDGYMNRWWVFNPYGKSSEQRGTRYPVETSARVHHILRPDTARDPHDHPWNARTVILRGWYIEERDDGWHRRERGDTATLTADEFHNIKEVSPGGVFTLFITGTYQHRWGFRVAGQKVPHNEYLNDSA